MKIVFFGTPEYVTPILDALQKEFKTRETPSPIVAVVTQPPKPIGRSKHVEYSAVDKWAHKKNIPIYFDAMELVNDGIEADLAVVASYGAMIPAEVLEYFPKGLLNIHPSHLPEFRGASPVQAMLITGKDSATVSIMKVDAQMDHGPIVSTFNEDILEEDTTEILRERLFKRSAEVLVGLIPAYTQNKITLKDQDHKNAVYTRLIKKEDGFIPFQVLQNAIDGVEPESEIEVPFIYTKAADGTKVPYSLMPDSLFVKRLISTMNPWPGVWTTLEIRDKRKEQRRLKILDAHLEKDLITSRFLLVPDLVQLEGKNPVSWRQFKEAYLS